MSPEQRLPSARHSAVRVQGWALADGRLYGIVVLDNVGGGIRLAEMEPLFIGYMREKQQYGHAPADDKEWSRLRTEAERVLRVAGIDPSEDAGKVGEP
jgi:hypothetical protein